MLTTFRKERHEWFARLVWQNFDWDFAKSKVVFYPENIYRSCEAQCIDCVTMFQALHYYMTIFNQWIDCFVCFPKIYATLPASAKAHRICQRVKCFWGSYFYFRTPSEMLCLPVVDANYLSSLILWLAKQYAEHANNRQSGTTRKTCHHDLVLSHRNVPESCTATFPLLHVPSNELHSRTLGRETRGIM